MSSKGDITARKSSSLKGSHAMILSAVLFAFGHAAVKWVAHLPFYQLVFLRAVITLFLCIVYMSWQGISFQSHNKKILIFRGLAGTVALVTYFYSLQHMPLASAVTIQYLSPILTLLIAHFVLKEKSTLSQGFYFLLAFIGILCVKGVDERISLFAFIISLISVVASAVAYNLVRVSKEYDNEWTVVLYYPLVTAPIVGPFAVNDWVAPVGYDWIFIFIIGVFTLLAQVFMTMAYHRARASDVAIYNYLGIFVALAIGYFFFGEHYSWLSLFGMILVMLAVFLGQRDQKQQDRITITGAKT